MLRLVTGPFHPTLESQLVHDLRVLKSGDPQAAVALVVPSDQLRRSLKRLLVVKRGLALLNVHILSFHQLALQLLRERRTTAGAAGAVRQLELVTDTFFERLLQHLGQRNVPQTGALRLPQLPAGAWPALWASVRDLKDATVDSALALRAVEEGQFPPEDGEKLKGLFTLYAALRDGSAALGVGSPDDLAALVTDFVPASPFLRSLNGLWYYGSYDLTQTQLTLLESLSISLPVTVYFPLSERPAYGFARQFLERHLYPIAGGGDERAGAPSGDGAHASQEVNVSVEVRNAAGIDDELTLVCKQILSLVETNGFAFDEIGVVGRTLVPYQASLKRTFDQHRIPFLSSATVPLLQEPSVKTLLHLARLKGSGLHRPAMLDVITSPWNRRLTANRGGVEPRPDLWRLAVLALGITRGEEEWRRLAQLGRLESWSSDADDPVTEELESLSIDGVQLRLLWGCLSPLIDDVKRLPEQGGYGTLTDAFCSLAETHLTVPLGVSTSIDATAHWDDAPDVNEALSRVFAQLRALDRLDINLTWDEWTETFAEILARTSRALAPSSHHGVQVLDAMAARGVGFRALFLVGMNEKLFPRYIHEDGFLRDRHRLVLSETLGYKIDQKLQGYGEEALLFELLRASAGERLYLSYQRADAAGRPLAPSGYLDAVGVVPHPSDPESLFALPRRWPDRVDLPLFTPHLQTREELAVSTVLQGRDVTALLEVVGRDGLLFSHGLGAQGVIESGHPALSAYDGMLEHAGAHWNTVTERGFSPTALETYARCPFQYFSGQVLKLESVRHVPSMELTPPAMGQLCHDALRFCYLALIQQGWPATALPASVITAEVNRTVAQAFEAYALTHGTGYALTWELAQESVRRLIEATVTLDRETALASGFHPAEFELDANGLLPDGSGGEDIPLRGRWDRVDRHPESGAVRVIDYKYRANDRVEAKDRNLLQAALRAQRLQPALYALMTPAGSSGDREKALPEQVEFLYLLPHADPAVERVSFAASAWQGPSGPMLSRTMQVLLDGIRAAQYFIAPDAHCTHCEFSTACRRAHQPSWWRAYRSSQARTLRDVRSQKVARD
ncbi:MAG: PD-(D/E)XK nuclease family protein [Nitrospira sp.]